MRAGSGPSDDGTAYGKRRTRLTRLRRGGVALLGLVGPVFGFVTLGAATTITLVMRDERPAEACHFGPYWYTLVAYNPWIGGNGDVFHEGKVSYSTSTEPCFNALELKGQRKVCGAFGCNYEAKVSTGPVGVNRNPFSILASQTCISGTHRYRSVSVLEWPSQNGPASDIAFSDGIEFQCK